MVGTRPVELRGRAGEPRPLRGARECGAALRERAGADQARELLEAGRRSTDHDTKLSPLAWLALFDLHAARGRQEPRSTSSHYSTSSSSSARRPPWEATDEAAHRTARGSGGYIATHRASSPAQSATQLEGLKRAIGERRAATSRSTSLSVTGFDDEGARLLADALGEARAQKFTLQLQRAEKLKPMLDAMVKKGATAGEGAWLLSLELLQWSNAHAAFEDRAVEYAVTFELSPPSWEPPVRCRRCRRRDRRGADAATHARSEPETRSLVRA